MLRSFSLIALSIGLGLAPGSARALPLISEVFYDATGSDNGKSFVELYGAQGTNLDGLVLEGVNGSNGAVGPILTLSGVIPEDGFFVVGDDRGDGASDVAGVDLVLNFDFQNGPDSVVLRSGDSVLDALGYGAFGVDEVFAGEGAPAPDAPSDASLARVFADVDSDDNAADFAILETPTPGSGSLAPVPEPGSVWMLAAGLVGLARAGRWLPRSA